ncbi:Transposon Ty3-I Gag-Pol polyprotein [Araneus ventricosus]|uniref:RNA-directed DNA polymerase n=1 Tax=Araneus ventricosus TaxID=182803 RepID=A0A4Y2PPX0_ARAVE|nr:Transposon Ty3-I Gag-Pol polyprotein [Araneus ventricosus]
MFSEETSTSLQLESKTARKSGLKSAVSSATNSAAENVKECRKFRLFARDRRSNLRFLVDSGADVSIFPATSQNKKKAEYQLYAANGTEISPYGIKMLNLDLGLCRDFQFSFIIADVTKEEHKCKTTILTPFGLYEFNVMSFGLKNAPATFQRFIHEVLRGLDFVFPYLDDILIASKSNQEHEIHLNLVLERLNTFGLRINISKSVFTVEEIEFLAYLITPQGSRPLPDKVQAIINYKRPENIQNLRTFLGILNFYRRYLKDAAKNQALLHEYLKGSKTKDKRKIQWTDEAEKQFEKCKNDLANATLLSFPNSELPLSLFTDASDTAIGAVLQQYENSTWQPIAFYSKKLNDTQQNYSTYDRELLGIYLSVKHFKRYLEGRAFTIYTDHKPLIFAFHQKLDKAAARQARQLNYISQFSTDIKYIKGENNIVADTLSRLTEVSSIDCDQIADAQTQDKN